ncbi:DMT family transporter [Azospirillum griseum]|uniref:DMT family transporter n=1 Tax=Azospirillum griseum TaxID=2496639 RepID=A0A431VE25_9PROT|nr:DMT family transporter [Azospirillum griseum]RTR17834.1 DMT family transporter [Azospirillum griseum]
MVGFGPSCALLAALLFGVSTPLAKLLIADLSPWMLAGVLYLGSGLGLAAFRLARRLSGAAARAERGVSGGEWGWLLAAVAAGGVAGPVLLMVGLTGTAASTASLLLNLESVLTALLAWLAFREAADRRLVLGMAAIVAGAVALSWPGEGPGEGVAAVSGGWGALAIAGACLMWALDNNLTRKVSLADPVDIAMIKGLVAGSVNVALALALGDRLPPPALMATAMAVGLLGYGVSLALFVLALRWIGAARTGAYFSTAPFVGALLSLPLFGEPVTVRLLVAAGLMGFGLWLHLTEAHDHEHEHGPLEHDHPHRHDAHHQHDHAGLSLPPLPADGVHSHPHHHTPLRHSHPHYPDAHHGHAH